VRGARIGRIARDRYGVDRRQLERWRQHADERHAGRAQDFRDLCAADRAARSVRRERGHRTRPVRMRVKLRLRRLVNAERAQHAVEVNAGGRTNRIGAIQTRGGDERGAQRVRIADRRQRIAVRDGDAGRHGTERRDRRGVHAPRGGERMLHRRGQDHDVAWRAAGERVANRARGVERRGDTHARVGLERRRERLDQSFRGSRRKQVQRRGAHRSARAPDTFTMRSHLTMSSAR